VTSDKTKTLTQANCDHTVPRIPHCHLEIPSVYYRRTETKPLSFFLSLPRMISLNIANLMVINDSQPEMFPFFFPPILFVFW